MYSCRSSFICGESALQDTLKTIDLINEGSKTKIELLKFKGTHHFHMISPKETAELILKFLDSSLKT